MAAILKIQDGRQDGITKNGNIGFRTQQTRKLTKMYSFAFPHKILTKLRNATLAT